MDAEFRSARQCGVTLIELMTVVVIVAVLAAVAIPSYRSHAVHARRSEATAALLQLQAAEEKFYLQHGRYTDNLTAPFPGGLGLSPQSANGLYDISITPDGGPGRPADQSYTATASPAKGAGKATDTQCTSFTLTDAGRRGATGPAGADACWR